MPGAVAARSVSDSSGPLLLAPARDDLHQLVTHQNGRPAMLDAAAHDPGNVREADLADQHRKAPVLAEGEP